MLGGIHGLTSSGVGRLDANTPEWTSVGNQDVDLEESETSPPTSVAVDRAVAQRS
jgi:hypothetical protein